MTRHNCLPIVIFIFITAAVSFAQSATLAAVKTGYAPVNGLNLYYEIHGSGTPLILLHGGLGSTESIANLTTALSQTHQVIAVDLQAHGLTADIDRPITCEAMADDIAALIKFLHIDKADAMGYSLGACTALQLTIRHPESIRKLVVVSTVFKRTGWYPEILAQMDQLGPASAEMMKPSPLYQTYTRIAPKPENWPVLVTTIGDSLRKDFDWSKDVAAITAPSTIGALHTTTRSRRSAGSSSMAISLLVSAPPKSTRIATPRSDQAASMALRMASTLVPSPPPGSPPHHPSGTSRPTICSTMLAVPRATSAECETMTMPTLVLTHCPP